MHESARWLVAIAKATLKFAPLVLRPYAKRAVKQGIIRMLPQHMGAKGAVAKALLKLPLAVPGGKHTLPPAGRRRGQLIVVYHDADRAGPHAEMYLYDPQGSGIAHNIGVIKLAKPAKLNNAGWVTNDERERIRKLIVAKGTGRDWIAFSTDHQADEAVSQWNQRELGPEGYGAGSLRQVIHVEDVEIHSDGSTVEFVSWWLDGTRPCYVHVVFPRTNSRDSAVGVIGFRKLSEPKLEDRLHLTFDGKDAAKFRRNLPGGRASLKIDGASAHFVSGPEGTRYFSPRESKETGRRIEYSFKLGQLQDVKSEEPIVGMGELVFVDEHGRELSSTEISGILNSDALPPANITPRLYVYRVDRVGRKDVLSEPYWEQNRPRCEAFAAKHRWLAVPPEIQLDDIESTRDREGVVGVPAGCSILDGRKLKWRADERDVTVIEVDFKPGDKGGVAGVVWYEDPAQPGRRFKTASGFSREEKQDMMAHPRKYEGRCMKISGYQGHGSRAAKFESWHLDKGTG